MWSPQHYIDEGIRQGFSAQYLQKCCEEVEQVKDEYDLPGLISLNHLAKRTGTSHEFLISVVSRQCHDAYRKFSIKKRSGGRRFIHVPTNDLMIVQRWISQHILSRVLPHKSSFAFSPGDSIVKCAIKHCGAKWLIKMDVQGFFESISEIQVFHVYRSLGYQPLVAFELARISTIHVSNASPRNIDPVWLVRKSNQTIPRHNQKILGYLPQGAPTSPMLSNLVMKSFDKEVFEISKRFGLAYTRYSDDLTFSTKSKSFGRKKAKTFINEISNELNKVGLKKQYRKTTVVPPGSRKIVLGLQVDGGIPKLSREFKDNIRQHFFI